MIIVDPAGFPWWVLLEGAKSDPELDLYRLYLLVGGRERSQAGTTRCVAFHVDVGVVGLYCCCPALAACARVDETFYAAWEYGAVLRNVLQCDDGHFLPPYFRWVDITYLCRASLVL